MNPHATSNSSALIHADHPDLPPGAALREAATTCVKACAKGAQAMQAAAQAVEVDLRATAAKIAAVTAAHAHHGAQTAPAVHATHIAHAANSPHATLVTQVTQTAHVPHTAGTPARTKSYALSSRASFYLLASLTVSFLAGSLAPTPLYPVYQAEWGFSALTVTEIFGIYALALLGSLLIFGRLSDHLGRRPVLIASTLMQVVVMGIFATAGGVGALILGRVLQGIATGAALGAIGAGMLDIDKTRGPVANSVAPPLGTGSGGLIAGFFVHYLPAPTHLVYIALAVVFLLQVLGLFFMSETVSKRAGALASLKPQLALPAAARAPMLLAAPMLVAVWALAGFYGALVPALMRKVLGLDPSFASGLAAFALAGSGALAVLLLRDTAPRKVMTFGTIGLTLGTLAVVLSFGLPSTTLFFVGSVIAGLGFGAGFQGAVRTVIPLAKPHERAGVLSVLFVISYLAMGLPAIAAGFFVARFGNLLGTAQAFSAGVMALALVALLGLVLGAKKN